MRRTKPPYGRRERGSWVTTDLLDALRGVPADAQVLFLYVRALAGRRKWLPTLKRVACIMGMEPDELLPTWERAARAGLFTDQWLGRLNLLTGGRSVFVTITALNELRAQGVTEEDQMVLFRFLPYVDVQERKLYVSRSSIAERARIPPAVVRKAFDGLAVAGVVADDNTFASYLF